MQSDDLSDVLMAVSSHVMDNSLVDHHKISKALHEAGYVEARWGSRFYRGIAHIVNNGDKLYGGQIMVEPTNQTLKAFIKDLRRNPKFTIGGAESFCDNIHAAMDFIGGTIHLKDYDHRSWPTHRPTTKVYKVKEIWVVYEVEAHDAVLWSMEGLKMFRHKLTAEQKAIIDNFLEHYGHDDEIILDTNKVKVLDVHLYDSTEHEIEYNFDPK